MTVLLELDRVRPAFFDRIPESRQRTDTGIATPREHHLAHAAHANQLVVNDIRRHADDREVAAALADDLVSGRVGDQVCEPLHRDAVAIVDIVSNRLGEGLERGQDQPRG